MNSTIPFKKKSLKTSSNSSLSTPQHYTGCHPCALNKSEKFMYSKKTISSVKKKTVSSKCLQNKMWGNISHF